MTFQIVTTARPDGTEMQILKRENADGTISWIPMDKANSDYQRYLNPEAEQSTPNV
jgi:hypothetical protein